MVFVVLVCCNAYLLCFGGCAFFGQVFENVFLLPKKANTQITLIDNWKVPFVFLFCSLCEKEKNPVSTPQKSIFGWFSHCLPLFLPSFSHSPLSLSLSLSLFLSIYSYFFSFFLVYFVFFFFFVPRFFAFVSWREQAQIIWLGRFLSSILSVSLVSCFVLSFKSLFLIYVLSYLELCFLFNVLTFKKKQLAKHQFWVKWGSQQESFSVFEYEKLSFLAQIWGKIVLMFAKHCKHRYFVTF